MRYSILERSEKTIDGVSVHPKNANIAEYCFNCKETEDGVIFQVMAAIPPFKRVNTEAIQESLRRQSVTSNPKDVLPLFPSSERKANTLHLRKPGEVLVAEYHLNGHGVLKKENLYLGRAELTRTLTFQEYQNCSLATWHTDIFMKIVKHENKGRVKSILKGRYCQELILRNGPGAVFVFGILHLFNHTCRNIARRHEIPFISTPDKRHELYFLISRGCARFHAAFDSPDSFLNAMNLVHFLEYRKIMLSKDELASFLPSH